MKKMMLLALVAMTTISFASARISDDHKIGSITVEETTPPSLVAYNKMLILDPTTPVIVPTTSTVPAVDPLEKVGKIVSTAKDMVALGEVIYTLIQHGKPSNTTEYAPISVVPKDPTTKEYVDPFDLEGFSMPVQRNFSVKVKSMTGKVAISFTYKLMYSYGGSYNGVGKYITGVQIIPASIVTTFGWDFKATMKVAGIMNHGTKADPVAGVLVAIKYEMKSWGRAEERNDTLHVTGNGQVKFYGVE